MNGMSANKNTDPREKFECKNKMLQCIADYKNLEMNGGKNDYYGDFITFERHFEQWDDDLIVLQRIDRGHDPAEYVYITIEGIFSNIGMFARRLQKILPHEGTGKKISVMHFGSDLSISIFEEGKDVMITSYRVTTHQLNQAITERHIEGLKFH